MYLSVMDASFSPAKAGFYTNVRVPKNREVAQEMEKVYIDHGKSK